MQDDRFPAIEPHDSGMLDVGDGHRASSTMPATALATRSLQPLLTPLTGS